MIKESIGKYKENRLKSKLFQFFFNFENGLVSGKLACEHRRISSRRLSPAFFRSREATTGNTSVFAGMGWYWTDIGRDIVDGVTMSTWKRNRKNRFCLVVMTILTRDEIFLYKRKPPHYGITFMAESGVNVSFVGPYENRTFAGFTHFFRYITQYWTAQVSWNILLFVPVKFSSSNPAKIRLT